MSIWEIRVGGMIYTRTAATFLDAVEEARKIVTEVNRTDKDIVYVRYLAY